MGQRSITEQFLVLGQGPDKSRGIVVAQRDRATAQIGRWTSRKGCIATELRKKKKLPQNP